MQAINPKKYEKQLLSYQPQQEEIWDEVNSWVKTAFNDNSLEL